MTTALLQPQKLPPANEGRVSPLSADERLLRKAVQRVLKAQVAEVHSKVEDKVNAVPKNVKSWDDMVMREVRPIWFGLFKKGGDRALKEIRKFPKHARKMAVLSWAEMQASERVEVVCKGGEGSGNFGHEGRPGEVGGSGEGGGGTVDGEGKYAGVKTTQNEKDINYGSEMGRGWFVMPDPKGTLVDVTGDFGGGSNDHVGIIVALEHPESVGVGKKEAAEMAAMFESGEQPDLEKMMGIWDRIYDQGIVRVRDFQPESGRARMIALNFKPDAVGLTRIQDYIARGKIPSDSRAEYSIEAGNNFIGRTTLAALVSAGSLKELEQFSKGLRNTKSLKATPSIVIPGWIEDPDVLTALENEMFKFAHGINQTTADDLRDELMAGMEDGETISQLADRISGLSDEWVEGWRSEMIARTETARAFSTGHIEAWRSTGVVSRKVWVAAGDACPFCQAMDGTVVDLDENFFDQGDEQTADWRGQEIAMGHDYSDVYGPPLHPNCLVHGSSQVYTSKGWKRIMDIQVGELVLTHKGRFRKVTKTHYNRYDGDAIKIVFGDSGRGSYLTVTADHPILVGDKWIMAKDIKKGDLLSILGHPCARCGKITPWNRKYCSHTCLSLEITDKQWADPNHRKNISRKASAQLDREYADGTRDKSTILLKAREQMDKLVARGIRVRPFNNPEVRKKLDLATRDPSRRRRSSLRMKHNNPSTIPEVRARMTASWKQTILLHPEKQPNVVMAQRGFISSIERKVKELLDAIGITYTQQHPVDRFFVDFAIPSLMVAIEVDGHYWHKDANPKDAARQKIIEDAGWHVVRFGEDRINEDLQSVSQELVRIAANHAGEYKFAAMNVMSVKRWKLGKPRAVYNLSVAEDESYIAKGMAVHNCRCVLVAELDESTNTEEP